MVFAGVRFGRFVGLISDQIGSPNEERVDFGTIRKMFKNILKKGAASDVGHTRICCLDP